MSARIYRPAKTAMQSGRGRTQRWLLEFEAETAKSREPLMGYTSSADTQSQVRMSFASSEDAVAYAEANGIDYVVEQPKDPIRKVVNYSSNFDYDRKVPWTH